MEFVVYAPVWGQSGFEQLSRGLLLALDQMGVAIELRTAHEWNSERVGLPNSVVQRLHRMSQMKVSELAPHVIYQLPKGQVVHPNAPVICYTLFETDRCPASWIDTLNKMDKVFVFSEFNKKSWSETGIDPHRLGRLPVAVDSFVYNPEGPKLEIENAKGFKFLMSGDFTERKNFEAVIEAYVKEFTSSDLVTLIIKTHYGGFVKKNRRDCMNRISECVNRFASKNPPRILFWGDKISDHAMAALYRSVDCFVLTSRGEGLGMQYLEAMASCVPVIACDWGAQTDYLTRENSYPVASQTKVIDDPNYILKCPQALNSKWCHVDIRDLQETLRFVWSNHNDRREKAERALKWAREQTWQKMAISFVDQVLSMYEPVKTIPVKVAA